LSNGETIAADLVVVGIGLEPNVEIARAAGLPIDNGIVVDGNARTSDPRIFAIGDCSNQPSELYGRRIRVESVPNAIEQAQFAALTIAGKTRTQASQVPWFWSDQYDLKLQMAGLSQGFDSTVRRESLKPRAFTLFYLKDGLVLAADSVNCPQDFMAAKQLIGRKIKVDAQRLADAAHPLAQFVPKASPAPTKNA
jgi:3-phenylpropionate/trans-cinnamate dioxygenase ferredoxin reductase subunit